MIKQNRIINMCSKRRFCFKTAFSIFPNYKRKSAIRDKNIIILCRLLRLGWEYQSYCNLSYDASGIIIVKIYNKFFSKNKLSSLCVVIVFYIDNNKDTNINDHTYLTLLHYIFFYLAHVYIKSIEKYMDKGNYEYNRSLIRDFLITYSREPRSQSTSNYMLYQCNDTCSITYAK